MKKFALITGILLAVSVTFAQTGQKENQNNDKIQTLFGDDVSNGGYGALMFNYSKINDEDAFLFGMRGGWLIDHKLTIGMSGYGFFSDMHWDNNDQGNDQFLTGGYGGLLIEPILFAHKPVHLAFPILIGGGGVALLDETFWDDYYDEWYPEYVDAFFVFEPGIELELNVVKAMRIAFAVTYRVTEDLELSGVDKKALNGLNFGMAMKFGNF